MPRSWTGEALEPVLASDPYKKRKVYDPSTDDRWKKGDMDIEDVGANAQMPWESDGRQWHTKDRVGRAGEPVKWDGEVLARVVDYIQQHEGFGETNWNDRSTVSILGTKKSQGAFLEASTGDPWFLKMKFRARPKTFRREELVDQIPLLRPNDMEDVPVYGNTPRVKIAAGKASWQEIEIKVHTLTEINIPGFWSFLDDAIASFRNKAEAKPIDVKAETPWAKLGEKWHFMRKGFASGTEIQWEPEVLETLHQVIQTAVPDGKFVWGDEQVVEIFLPSQERPWASIETKKNDAVKLQLSRPVDAGGIDSITVFEEEPVVRTEDGFDFVEMSFSQIEQVSSEELKSYLVEHAGSIPH